MLFSTTQPHIHRTESPISQPRQPRDVFEEDDQPANADGRQFDAVGKYEEPDEPGPGDVGPSIPEAPDTASAKDADPTVQNLFWSLVVIFNVAIVAVAVGAMMVGFGTHPTLGLQVLLAGLIVAGYGLYRYREARREVATLVGDGDEDND